MSVETSELEKTNTENKKLTKKDFETAQDVRWCPGCGDYSVLAAVQRFLPSLGIAPENIVFVSGIGCSSRFPYYMNTYGFHTIHGRAPAVATGVKIANPDLSVWMITGDGDCFSIGGNHIIHLLRRNVDINVILLNNRIYGLTKGQYSPTSEPGKVTGSSPFGSIDHPLNPISVALSADATFVARSLDKDAKHMTAVFEQATKHKGTSFIEIFQNCNIFNDGAFDDMSERAVRAERQLQLVDGKPLVFGADNDKGIAINDFKPKVVAASDPGVVTYDSKNRELAQILSRLTTSEFPVPMGVFFQESRETFETAVTKQQQVAIEKKPIANSADENIEALLQSGETWLVS